MSPSSQWAHLLELDAIGANACCEVADKNDKKTSADSHTVEPSSGKLIKRSQAQ